MLALGDVCTAEDATALKNVEVVAQRPIVKMEPDKMTYNVQEDGDSKSMTLLDMLRKVPMVTVDGQDNISVNGSASFKVYVDGKPNPMFQANASQIFKSLPASMVKNIDVITNPGAKPPLMGMKYSKRSIPSRNTRHVVVPPAENPPNARWVRDCSNPVSVTSAAKV